VINNDRSGNIMPDIVVPTLTGWRAVQSDRHANLPASQAAYRWIVRNNYEAMQSGNPERRIISVLDIGDIIGYGASPVEVCEFMQDPTKSVKLFEDKDEEIHEISKDDMISPDNPDGICPPIEWIVDGNHDRGYLYAIESWDRGSPAPSYSNEQFVFNDNAQQAFKTTHTPQFFAGYHPKAFSDIIADIVTAIRDNNAHRPVFKERIGTRIFQRLLAERPLSAGPTGPNLERGLEGVMGDTIVGAIEGILQTDGSVEKRWKGLKGPLSWEYKITERGKSLLMGRMHGREAAQSLVTTFLTSPYAQDMVKAYQQLNKGLFAYAYLLANSGVSWDAEGKLHTEGKVVAVRDKMKLTHDNVERPGSQHYLEGRDLGRAIRTYIGPEKYVLYGHTHVFAARHDEYTQRWWINDGQIGRDREEVAGRMSHKISFPLINPDMSETDLKGSVERVKIGYGHEEAERKRLIIKEAARRV
jgi:hypothetical protein